MMFFLNRQDTKNTAKNNENTLMPPRSKQWRGSWGLRMIRPKNILIVMCFFFMIAAVSAQLDTQSYTWETANYTLRYPADWAEPQTSEQEAAQILLLSSVAEAAPDNPPDNAPFLLLKRIPVVAQLPETYDVLRNELSNLGITPIAPLPTIWLNAPATEVIGTNGSQSLFGTGRIMLLPDEPAFLLIIGRAPYEQRELLRTQFNLTAASLTRGQNPAATTSAYGTLWQTQSLMSDGPTAFANITAMTAGVDDSLVVVDSFAGAVQFDSATGTRLMTYPFSVPARPTSVVTAPDGTLYVTDLQCQCVLNWQDDEWEQISTGYAQNAPFSMTITPDGTLYVTDTDTNGTIYIRVITADAESRLIFEVPLREQPLLTTDASGRVLVLTQQGEVLGLEGAGFTSLYTLQVNTGGSRYTAWTVDNNGRLVVATERAGLVFVNDDGTEASRLALPPAALLPPLALRGVVVGADGTLYTAEGENGMSLLRAFSQGILPGRNGAEFLRPGQPVGGVLDNITRQQIWFFEAERGTVIDLTISPRPDAFNLDTALRLLEPDGDELVFIDNLEPSPELPIFNLSSPLLRNTTLEETGLYTLIIERVTGTGGYDLSLTTQQTIALSDDAVTTVSGQLSDASPIQRYAFQGRGGQTLTITLSTDMPQLDPVLFLRNPDGELLAQNDNALDPTLRQNAQIVEIELPRNGIYVIEATRFRGFGQYVLEIEIVD